MHVWTKCFFESNQRALNGSRPCFTDFKLNKNKELFKEISTKSYQNSLYVFPFLFFLPPKSLKTLQLMNKIKAQNVINHNYHIISYLPYNSCLRAFFTWRWGTCLGGLTRLSIWSLILISSRLHVRWGNPLHVTTPTWGPPPPCKQALSRDTFGSVKICLFWQFWVQEFSADAS